MPRADDPEGPHRPVWLVHGLTGANVIAKLGWSVTQRGSLVEVAGVLGYWRDGWDVMTSAPVRRAIKGAGLDVKGMRATIGPASAFDDDSYCGARVSGALELVCDVLAGMPALRLKSSGAYVASHRLALSDRTHAALQHWDDTYRHVFTVWLNSGMYEAWAEREIFRRDSELNKVGRKVARMVAKDTGLKVSEPIEKIVE